MKNLKELYESLMAYKNLNGLENEFVLELIGKLIDVSWDIKKVEGLKHAIELSNELQTRKLKDSQIGLINYFLGNAWYNIRRLTTDDKDWIWEQEEMEKEIIHFRTALIDKYCKDLPSIRVCQILTNLGNIMDELGRFVEAVEYWDKALDRTTGFPMAQGNKGYGLFHYAKALYDKGHAALMIKYAYYNLNEALSHELEGNAGETFEKYKKLIETMLSPEFLKENYDVEGFSLGDTEDEIRYRKWCLKEHLFLNPLNDLGAFPIGGRDVFSTPSMLIRKNEGPVYQGFFNQLKQEYVSARYLYYEGITANSVHFSDKEVLLYNTLDYPSYSINVEKIKISYRITYSLFDKMAHFLNNYFRLQNKKVYFRSVWYIDWDKKKGLNQEFLKHKNWPLRGLFWLSKDFFEDNEDFKNCLQPDAQELNYIRNCLEHRYFKLHDDLWPGKDNIFSLNMTDTLALSMYRKKFEIKTLRLLKMARAALIYLSLSIHREEIEERKNMSPNTIVGDIPLDNWDDEWKV